jgi:hypothetical protein
MLSESRSAFVADREYREAAPELIFGTDAIAMLLVATSVVARSTDECEMSKELFAAKQIEA